MKPPRRTVEQAIAILAEAAVSDGAVFVAATRLGLYPTEASMLAIRAFYDEAVCPVPEAPVIMPNGHLYAQADACAAAEGLMLQGWLPS